MLTIAIVSSEFHNEWGHSIEDARIPQQVSVLLRE